MGMVLGQIIQQAATGTVIGGVAGSGGTPPPGSIPGEDELMGGGNRRRRPVIPPIPFFRTRDNISTNRNQDNEKNKDEQNCKLFEYRHRKTQCPNGNAHHAIPDHCWRMGNSVYLSLGRAAGNMLPLPGALKTAAADKIAQTFEESMVESGRYYHANMGKQDGLSICVEGAGKTLIHGAIHTLFDDAEKKLGETGDPKWTAKLGNLEDAAAETISKETGCNKEDIKKQLKTYHVGKNLGEDTLLRADPFGKKTTSMTDFKIDPIVQKKMSEHSSTSY